MKKVEYTKEQVDAVIAKFNKYGRGVLISPYQTGAFKSKTGNAGEVMFSDLCNPELYGANHLQKAYQFYYDKMSRQAIDPEVFGDEKVPLFVHTTPLDEDVVFTAEDAFILVRAALLEQKRIEALVELKEKARQAQLYLQANETRKAKREKANAIIEAAKAAGISL